jgi:hypothetical protein
VIKFRLRSLLIFTAIVAIALGVWAVQHQRIVHEHRAYRELRQLGAHGDDWVSFRELIHGPRSAPIVYIWLPATVDLDVALPHLMKLRSLELLELSGRQLDEQDVECIGKIRDAMPNCEITHLPN